MKKEKGLLSCVAEPILGVVDMKMVLISGTVAILIGVVAYVILVNSGMDTASVYSGPDVRL